MDKNNILNIGLIILLGLGSLNACNSKSYPPSESSQPIDSSPATKLTDLTSQSHQYESKGLKIKLSGDAKYDKSKNQISVNNGDVLVSFSNKCRAAEKPLKILTDQFGLIVINPNGTGLYMRVREGFFQVDGLRGSINVKPTKLSTKTYNLNSGQELFWRNGLNEPQIRQISKTVNYELQARLSELDECKKRPGCLENLRSARKPKSEPNTPAKSPSLPDKTEKPHEFKKRLNPPEPYRQFKRWPNFKLKKPLRFPRPHLP